jgi:hypothetical protein
MTAPHPSSLDARILDYVRRFPWGASERDIRHAIPGPVGPALRRLVESRALVQQGRPGAPTYRIPARTESDLPPIPEKEPSPMRLATQLAQPGTTIREQVLAYLTHHGESTIADIVASTTWEGTSVRAALPKLAKAGEIVRVREGVYDVAPGEAEPSDEAVEAMQRHRPEPGMRPARGLVPSDEVAALRKRLEDADREVDAAQDLLDEVAKDRDDAHRESAEARATIESLREEQRQDHAELDAIDAALGFHKGTTRSEGDRVRQILRMKAAEEMASKTAREALADTGDVERMADARFAAVVADVLDVAESFIPRDRDSRERPAAWVAFRRLMGVAR